MERIQPEKGKKNAKERSHKTSPMVTQETASDHAVRDGLTQFLRGGQAHVSLDDAVKNFPVKLAGQKPEGAPHTAWQLLEHIRLTLHDLVEFCANPKYRAPKWPEDYWPKREAPASAKDWETSLRALRENITEFERMMENPETNLTAKIPWGDGQTVLREVLLAIDHTSYHVGQLVMLRKQLGEWEG
jgi:uncharacterized damage-inducible protein DinB